MGSGKTETVNIPKGTKIRRWNLYFILWYFLFIEACLQLCLVWRKLLTEKTMLIYLCEMFIALDTCFFVHVDMWNIAIILHLLCNNALLKVIQDIQLQRMTQNKDILRQIITCLLCCVTILYIDLLNPDICKKFQSQLSVNCQFSIYLMCHIK